MRIPEHKIEEILAATDIVDVVGKYVYLKKAGTNFKGICPFHSEKTPSMIVSPAKQIFNCFGCHVGGNAFRFLMEYKKISFVEAVQEQANELGVTIQYEESKSFEQKDELEVLYDLNTEVAKYYLNNLLNTPEGEAARKYFEERKIKQQAIRSFGLGYSPPKRDALFNFLSEKKLDIENALQLGVIGKGNTGEYYDRFAGRIIFPIFSPNGRVVAFAGRILVPNENTGKYVNSPESKIYYKSRILYALSFAKDEIRRSESVIVVEGYMDAISLHQKGIKNVVAVSGTALTEEQIQLLSRYTKNVNLIFDADSAGIRASMRSIELLLKQDMNVKIISLPQGEDPDSYVNKFGADDFLNEVKNGKDFLEYQSMIFKNEGRFDDSAKMSEAIRVIVNQAALIPDELKRTLQIQNVAKKFNLREKLIEKELDKILQSNKKSERRSSVETGNEIAKAEPTAETNRTKNDSAIFKIEQELLKILFEGNRAANNYIFDNYPVDDFSNDDHKKLAEIALEGTEENLKANEMVDKIDDLSLQSYLLEIIIDKYDVSDRWSKYHYSSSGNVDLLSYANDAVRKIKLLLISDQLESKNKLINSAESEEDKMNLMKEIKLLTAERKTLLQKETKR